MPSLLHSAAALLLSVAAVSAQSVSGTAYGFAAGVTGGGSAKAVTPADTDELAKLLADDTARVINLDKTYDFRGKTAQGEGCGRSGCKPEDGGDVYLDTLSCGGSDNFPLTITYDTAGKTALPVGSNKSIISSNGKGVIKGKGLSIKSGAKNVIVQGITITEINAGIVWGGDAFELKGNNDGVWVDHCAFSLVGRMMVVSHYDAVRLTLSNNEFNGQTTKGSASCNNNHYWTMMFYGKGDQVTFDRNYFHDVSGRAPKLGEDGTPGTFQAVNNLFSNMKGHAFDSYTGAQALIEGNVFQSVSQPMTDKAAKSTTIYNVADSSAASGCSSTLGRKCEVNSFSSSGKWTALKGTAPLTALAANKKYLVTPVAASGVASLVKANAGPAGVGKASATTPVAEAEEEVEEEETTTPAPAEPAAPAESSPAAGSGSGSVPMWGQCGGSGYSGATTCAAGKCEFVNDWYSQCV